MTHEGCTVCKSPITAHFRMQLECDGDPEAGEAWLCDHCYQAVEKLLIALRMRSETAGSA